MSLRVKETITFKQYRFFFPRDNPVWNCVRFLYLLEHVCH